MARTVAVTGATTSNATARRTVGTRAASAAPRTTGGSDRTNQRSFRQGSEEGKRAASSGGRGGRGFGAWKKAVKDSGKEYNNFQVPADQVKVIAFMEAENFDFVFRHWVPTVTDDGRTIRVPRNCIEDPDKEVRCPLCDVGDEPKPVALFNIVDLDEPGKVQLWEAGKEVMKRVEKLFTTLQDIPEDRGGPLALNSPGVYAAVSREKKSNGYWEYTVDRVKERDLDEDHGLDPLTEDQLEAALGRLNDSSVLKFNTVEELRELADSLED